MAHKVRIDSEKCVGCGLCSKDCVAGNITLVNGKAMPIKENCIFCGHCEAICPQNAVKLTGFSDEPQEYDEQVRLDPEILMQAIKTRRTVRSFTEEKVPAEILAKILEAGRQAPTGSNAQRTSYVVIQDKIEEIESMALDMFRKMASAAKPLFPGVKNLNLDDHFFFKKAPLVIVIAGSDKVSSSLAAENMAFMAEACGLGVLYSGFFTMAANFGPKLHAKMNFIKGHKAVTTLVIGYPNVKYHRTVRREDLNVQYM